MPSLRARGSAGSRTPGARYPRGNLPGALAGGMPIGGAGTPGSTGAAGAFTNGIGPGGATGAGGAIGAADAIGAGGATGAAGATGRLARERRPGAIGCVA